MSTAARRASIKRSLHALRAARKALALCRECGARTRPGKRMCGECAASHNADARKSYLKAKAAVEDLPVERMMELSERTSYVD